MRRTILFIILFGSSDSIAQPPDTPRVRSSSDSSHQSVSWKKFHPGIRLAIGLQQTFFAEIGFSLQKYIYNRFGFYTPVIYSSYEWTPATAVRKTIHGLKAGVESTLNGHSGGVEIKYLTNTDSNDIMITPRIGLGVGFVNVLYGYNFSVNKYPFHIGKHQFSLVLNSNILFHHLKYRKR